MIFARQGILTGLFRIGALLLLLAGIGFVLPRLLPASLLGSLDAASATTMREPIDDFGGRSFPGSASFSAEGAFDPAPTSPNRDGPHVFRLENGSAAASTRFRGLTVVDGYRAANCLAAAIYYEAGNEPEEGQRAVAQVVLNRVRHPAWPHSICGVVYQGSERTDLRCQFSFSCDGAMTRPPNAAGWERARRLAVEALSGYVFAPVGLATYYHTLAVKPDWSARLQPVAVVGAHIFYRWRGAEGMGHVFRARYAGIETQSGPAPRALTAAVPPSAFSVQAPLPVEAQLAAGPSEPPGVVDLPASDIRPEYRSSGQWRR